MQQLQALLEIFFDTFQLRNLTWKSNVCGVPGHKLKTCFRLDHLFVRIQGMEKREAREMEKTTNFHI